jgi:hypothetical protein
LSGTVRGEYRKYEITIRNCVGNKSPAEEIVELKNQLVVALENGAKNERERIRKFLYPDKIRWKDGMFHYVTWGDVFESLRTPSNKESK